MILLVVGSGMTRGRVSRSRSGVISTSEWLVVLIRCVGYGSRLGVVGRANIMSRGGGQCRVGCDFGVAESIVTVLTSTAKEASSSTTRRVVVGRARSKALLLLVVARKSDLDEC